MTDGKIGFEEGVVTRVFDGLIDDVRIFDVALSVAEMKALKDIPVDPPFPAAEWGSGGRQFRPARPDHRQEKQAHNNLNELRKAANMG